MSKPITLTTSERDLFIIVILSLWLKGCSGNFIFLFNQPAVKVTVTLLWSKCNYMYKEDQLVKQEVMEVLTITHYKVRNKAMKHVQLLFITLLKHSKIKFPLAAIIQISRSVNKKNPESITCKTLPIIDSLS